MCLTELDNKSHIIISFIFSINICGLVRVTLLPPSKQPHAILVFACITAHCNSRISTTLLTHFKISSHPDLKVKLSLIADGLSGHSSPYLRPRAVTCIFLCLCCPAGAMSSNNVPCAAYSSKETRAVRRLNAKTANTNFAGIVWRTLT